MKFHEVVLWMRNCPPERLTPNTVMLCARGVFIMENMRDLCPDEYIAIIRSSGDAGIVRL